MKVNSYKDLVVYKKAYELVLEVYKLTSCFPQEERFGLTQQIRRCSISIPSNIAEGYRRGKKEYIQFLKIAQGSCAELETQLSLACDIGFIDRKNEDFKYTYNLQEEVSKLLATIIKKMNNGGSK